MDRGLYGSKKDMLSELRKFGVTHNKIGSIEKMPASVLEGVLEKVRQDEKARKAKVPKCEIHPSEYAGICLYCRGIWAEPDDGGEGL